MTEKLGPRYSTSPGPKGNRYGDWRSDDPCPKCGGTQWYLASYGRLVCAAEASHHAVTPEQLHVVAKALRRRRKRVKRVA